MFARGRVQARLTENSSDNFCFSPQLVLQWFINGLFQRKLFFPSSEGVQHFAGGSNIFQGGSTFSRWGGGGGVGGLNAFV